MKRTKHNNKLKLGKEVVSSLTRNEQNSLLGGEAAFTTSYVQCSGFACCRPKPSRVLECITKPNLEEGFE